MNYALLIALALIAISWQLSPSAGQGIAVESCRSRDAVASAAAPDFLFASAEEWKRFALEAELDRRR